MNHTHRFADRYNDADGKIKDVMILDSTLREGEQAPGVTFTTRQRIQIAWMLDYFGVNFIEISPSVSPSHEEAEGWAQRQHHTTRQGPQIGYRHSPPM
ncbi:MAG: hypothetical protein QW815_04970 [Nitrososphaerota archaeon]